MPINPVAALAPKSPPCRHRMGRDLTRRPAALAWTDQDPPCNLNSALPQEEGFWFPPKLVIVRIATFVAAPIRCRTTCVLMLAELGWVIPVGRSERLRLLPLVAIGAATAIISMLCTARPATAARKRCSTIYSGRSSPTGTLTKSPRPCFAVQQQSQSNGERFGGKDRSEASMREFYTWLGKKNSARIQLAVMDMGRLGFRRRHMRAGCDFARQIPCHAAPG